MHKPQMKQMPLDSTPKYQIVLNKAFCINNTHCFCRWNDGCYSREPLTLALSLVGLQQVSVGELAWNCTEGKRKPNQSELFERVEP
ncbi:hypothetical protein AVEN_88615-1 [Araneus ventricosus]|uniref:Uncharacterized protein n=1 Tax=Araneus ventricosus TaxID=182803 RepID=A0A4Y2FPP4_ARAVE|nr:hypothetical protein AVEN_88615-1 [Araneus ventricosus]